MSEPMPLLRGTLDTLVLKALSWAPMHSFEVLSWIETASDGGLDVDDGALYQSLQRLERRGLIAAEWGTTEHNRRARYYELTSEGRANLQMATVRWHRYSQTVAAILGPAAAQQ